MELKRLMALLISAVAFGCGVAAVAGCKPKDTTNNASGTEQGGTEQGGTESKNYSQILQTVLTDDYYKDLIDSQQYLHFNNSLFNAAPFKFLEQRGHNMDSIKRGYLMCDTYIYFVGNNKNSLYMSVKTDNSVGDVTNYVIKYNISNQEYEDLKMLYSGNYIQAPLFIQELDNQRPPVVESCVTVTYKTYKMLLDYFNTDSKKDIFNSNSIDIDITKINTNRELEINARDKDIKDSTTNSHQLRKYSAKTHVTASLTCDNDTYSILSVKILSDNFDEFSSTYQTIHYFEIIENNANLLTVSE